MPLVYRPLGFCESAESCVPSGTETITRASQTFPSDLRQVDRTSQFYRKDPLHLYGKNQAGGGLREGFGCGGGLQLRHY